MKRLLCIVGSMNAGGAETFLMKMYRQLDRTKYQMDFAVAVAEDGFYDKEIISHGGKIYHITPKSDGIIKNFNDIRLLVKAEGYQYVLRTSQHSLSALELLAAKLGGAKVRVFRSSNSNTTTGSKKQLIIHKVCLFMPKYFANVRIAPSTEAAEFMFGKGCIMNGTAHILHNAIDLTVYKYREEDRKRIRKELGLTQKFVVGHIGRFNQQKNHRVLIELFLEIKKNVPNAVLVLVGDGELKDSIFKLVKEWGIEGDVIFTGIRKDIPSLLSAFDVFLFPSLYEGMPNTVIEAQATGLPCVISDTITKEVELTNTVKFISLSAPKSVWCEAVLNSKNKNRSDAYKKLCEKKYDVVSTVYDFVDLVFEGSV